MCERDQVGPEFNENAQPQNDVEPRNYSEEEMHRLINNYKVLAEPESKDQKFMEQLHQHYMDEADLQEQMNYLQQMEFNLALDQGVQIEGNRIGMLQNQFLGMQQLRDEIVQKAKEYYHPNYSVSRSFEDVSKDDKDMDMVR